MQEPFWSEKLPAAITVSDENGTIVYMNNKSAETFANDGGRELIGKNLFECHNENSNNIIEKIISSRETNVYTIEKKGIKKLIYQAPVYDGDTFLGLTEISIELHENMPPFNRA
jgi:PAS domain S-box-containing protein